jgi:hypothetical protein
MALAATAMFTALGLSTIQPARADGAASTRNIIFGAAALFAGIAIESNVAHKNAVADTVQGYLPDGATVYEDGHVVNPDGTSYYPSNEGLTVACNDGSCSLNDNGYNTYSAGNGHTEFARNGYGYNGSDSRERAHRRN